MVQQRGRQISADGFASRGDYGLYLRDRLASLLRDGSRKGGMRFDFVKAKATDCIQCDGTGLVFHLDSGEDLSARNVVLCLGVGNADMPLAADRIGLTAINRVIRNPWRLSWLSRVRQSDPVCILGSGLTMIDQVLALRTHGHRGPVHVLSRRGLLPHAHARRPISPVKPDLSGARDISALAQDLATSDSGGRRLARLDGRLAAIDPIALAGIDERPALQISAPRARLVEHSSPSRRTRGF